MNVARQVALVIGAWGLVAGAAGALAARALRHCDVIEDLHTKAWLDEQFAAQRAAKAAAEAAAQVEHLERLYAASPSMDEQPHQH